VLFPLAETQKTAQSGSGWSSATVTRLGPEVQTVAYFTISLHNETLSHRAA
jgi:hypothetical protein